MSFWEWLLGRIAGGWYDPAVERFRMKREYRPREGERLIAGLYLEVERLDGEIEYQRQLSRSPMVPAIERMVARETMRFMNAQRANRISIAREIERRIVSVAEDHPDVIDEEDYGAGYIESFYRRKLLQGRETLSSITDLISSIYADPEHGRGKPMSRVQRDHVISHLWEEFE
jgi:hypothetical protein